MKEILKIKNLSFEYQILKKTVKALRGVDFTLYKGESVAVVGESGCGKSTFASAILDLIPLNEGRITGGEIKFYPEDELEINLMNISREEMRGIRGNNISMILQDPYNSLNPVIRIDKQLEEAYLLHNPGSKRAEKVIKKKIADVHLHHEIRIIRSYPHQLSGGMLQRICIAMSLLNSPQILIADEPTSNLDVTIQKKIIESLTELKSKFKLSMIFISHNLNLVSEFADRIYILYAGEAVEYGPAKDIFKAPVHPYTKGLLAAIPNLSQATELRSIPGNVPDLSVVSPGCSYAQRCDFADNRCREGMPYLEKVGKNHFVRCFKK
jgi:oligopeptide/dipeptide ABC transporter ATP-binding protein